MGKSRGFIEGKVGIEKGKGNFRGERNKPIRCLKFTFKTVKKFKSSKKKKKN